MLIGFSFIKGLWPFSSSIHVNMFLLYVKVYITRKRFAPFLKSRYLRREFLFVQNSSSQKSIRRNTCVGPMREKKMSKNIIHPTQCELSGKNLWTGISIFKGKWCQSHCNIGITFESSLWGNPRSWHLTWKLLLLLINWFRESPNRKMS